MNHKQKSCFNVKEYFDKHVKSEERIFQIDWVKFEYVRRNEIYKKEWNEFLNLPNLEKDSSTLLGFREILIKSRIKIDGDEHHILPKSPLDYWYEVRITYKELCSKWRIAYASTYERPLPKWEEIDYAKYESIRTAETIRTLSPDDFSNIKTITQLPSELTGIYPLETFQIWKKEDQSFSCEWDTDSWTLVAINKRASKKQIEEVVKSLTLHQDSRGKGFNSIPHLRCLRAWDLRKIENKKLKDVASIINSEFSKDDKDTVIEQNIGVLIQRCEEHINGNYQLIK